MLTGTELLLGSKEFPGPPLQQGPGPQKGGVGVKVLGAGSSHSWVYYYNTHPGWLAAIALLSMAT